MVRFFLRYRYAALLKHCEGRTWLGKSADDAAPGGQTAAAVKERTIDVASYVAPVGITPPVSAEATQQVHGIANCSSGKTAPGSLLPFVGSTELSDGTTVDFYPWLQRQLVLLLAFENNLNAPTTISSSSNSSSSGSSGSNNAPYEELAVAVEEAVGAETAQARAARSGKRVSGKLTPEQARRLQVLLERGVAVFRWVASPTDT